MFYSLARRCAIPAMAIHSLRMFYRGVAMREMPCCRQHLCCFCLSEFVRSKLTKQPGGADPASGGKASPSPEEVPSRGGPTGASFAHCFYYYLLLLLLTTHYLLDGPGAAA